MRAFWMLSIPLLLVGLALGGCRGCGKTPETPDAGAVQPAQAAADAGPAVAKPQVTPSRQLSDDGRMKSPKQYLPEGPLKATANQPLPLNRVPTVTVKEIEQDTRLANPKLPYASKRTLKILEKMQQANPGLTQKYPAKPGETNEDHPAGKRPAQK